MATNASQSASSDSQPASTQIECRTFQQPDDALDFAHHGKIEIPADA